MLDLVVRYFHFIGMMVLMSLLVVEHILVTPEVSNKTMKRLATIDGFYGASAGVVFIMGFLLWFVVGKSSEFYTSNLLFHIKLTLFVVVGLLSIIPTLYFIKQRKSEEPVIAVPRRIIMVIRLELLLLLIIPALAVCMASGIGLR